MKPHPTVSPRQEARAEKHLYQAILTLKSVEECRAFFRDLQYLQELGVRYHYSRRWQRYVILDPGIFERELIAKRS